MERMIADGIIGLATMDGAMMMGGMTALGGLVGKHGLVTGGIHNQQS